jgi:hypothetical protein
MSESTSKENSFKEKLYKELDKIVNKGKNIPKSLTLDRN